MTTRVPRGGADLRKRPRQTRSEAMVAAILEAAARILETGGIEACTTNAIAATAGVSVGSLYQYFPNRLAILAELTRRERVLLSERIAKAMRLSAGAPFEDAIRALVGAAVAHQLDRPNLARALDFIEPTLMLEEEAAALSDDLIDAVTPLLARQGITRAGEAARDLVAMAKGMIDAAGLAGETKAAALSRRVCRAAFGYLGLHRLR